jgi:hypothetical protein
MAIPLMEYAVKPVYAKISDRFIKKYNIHLGNHVDSMSHVSNREQEGITFVPRDDQRLIAALKSTGAFHHDDRAHLVGQLAAAATAGEGYREIADSSLHCQISKSLCNIHIDYIGFVWRGPNGESFVGPDALRHIVDELGWGKIVEWVNGKNQFAGEILGRLHPVVPSVATKFMPAVGLQIDLLRGDSLDVTKQWSLVLDFHYGCTSYACNQTEAFKGLMFTYKH